ncbi:Ubiquinol-cytochrome c reductase iron-sulfur subunit [Nymphon striatum]|nr:Ubiquinol-cytochrome c reductase iron-sulfur subunit [Nymphon striatum]
MCKFQPETELVIAPPCATHTVIGRHLERLTFPADQLVILATTGVIPRNPAMRCRLPTRSRRDTCVATTRNGRCIGLNMEHTLVSHAEDHEGTRRDFLYYATAGAGAVATGAAVWPLVNQMNPSADVRALSSIRVDIADVEPGTQLTVKWLGKPVFIRRRTDDEIEAARAVEMSELIDPIARNDNKSADLPATDENRAMDETGEWLVQMGVCTHLGCVPLGDGAGDFGGWFCPCHGSHYDTSGRIRKGPAPENLPVPPAEFVDDSTIQLG